MSSIKRMTRELKSSALSIRQDAFGNLHLVNLHDDKDIRPKEMELSSDWQVNKEKLSERSQYILNNEKWSDCNFIVGQEPHQQTVKGHKLFLAMSSPVFEAMFYGGMAEKNDPILITDIQPQTFRFFLQYIYFDRMNLDSIELACDLCYCAKKYMLPFLVEKCIKYLWCNVSPKKACRTYEFAKLLEQPILLDRCLQIICTQTNEVLNESTWEDVELGTLVTVLEQDSLQISSEIELFTAMERWAKAECSRKSLDTSNGKSLKSVIGNALSKIRFLSLTPQEFAEGPGMSALLTQDETFSILMNLHCRGKVPMPKDFCTNLSSRVKQTCILIGSQRYGNGSSWSTSSEACYEEARRRYLMKSEQKKAAGRPGNYPYYGC